MLSESYAPMKIAPTEQPEEEQTGDVVRSSIFAYPQYDDYRKKNQRSLNTSEDRQMEAIEIKINESLGKKIKYRVHVQDYGWMDWKQNGELAGTTGENKRIEAIEIKVE